MHREIVARVEGAIRDKVFPGCVVGVVDVGGKRGVWPLGRFTYDESSSVVGSDTIYDLASVTKSIPVAALALNFLAEKKFTLSDAVTKYLPELQNEYGATIEDLLRYRVQGAQLSQLKLSTFEEIRSRIFETGFSGPPAEHVYTNLPAFLLGMILERVSGQILPALAHEQFFGPLEMHDTTFFPHDIARIPPTEVDDVGNEVRGVVHDESARVFARARRAVGHAGLFSTAPDVLNYLEALLQGKYPHVVEGAQKGLGWQVDGPLFGKPRDDTSGFGKTGFTGTSVVCDMKRGVAFTILSNRTYPRRPPDATSIHSAINVFRAAVADILLR